jgi:ribosomal protein S18 acetylase RimI-like enzyme
MGFTLLPRPAAPDAGPPRDPAVTLARRHVAHSPPGRRPSAGSMSVHTLRWPGGWARIGPFRPNADVARLTMGIDAPPSPNVVERCLGLMQARRYKAVVTNALSPADSLPFVDAGFAVRERLHLLAHDLADLPPVTISTRRARRHDRLAVLDLDATAFDGDWHLDHDGLDEALRATPVTRFRVTTGTTVPIAGYAVTGRAGRNGYLQRVAVHSVARRRGYGRGLVADALCWLRRRSIDRALVNTQLDNSAALALYESCGFRRLPVGLCVLGRAL